METVKPNPEAETERSILALQSRICKAMGHPVRLEIVHRLVAGETAASNLLQSLDISKASLSKHVTQLLGAGIIAERRDGRQVHYRLTCPEIHAACELMRSIILQQLQTGDRLALVLERSARNAP